MSQIIQIFAEEYRNKKTNESGHCLRGGFSGRWGWGGGPQGARAPPAIFSSMSLPSVTKIDEKHELNIPPTIFHLPRIYGTGDIFYTENIRDF